MSSLLEIQNLSTFFYIEEGIVEAVRNVDLSIRKGETLALVGESGCGKSVTALSILRLIPTPPGKFETGQIVFDGQSIFSKTEKEMEQLRGNDISMIFQEPMTSLNPIFRERLEQDPPPKGAEGRLKKSSKVPRGTFSTDRPRLFLSSLRSCRSIPSFAR